MPEITSANPELDANQKGDTYKPRTSYLGGGHVAHVAPADPTTGDKFRAAGQDDIAAVADAVAAVEAKLSDDPATDASQQAAVVQLTAIVGRLAALVGIAPANSIPGDDAWGLPMRQVGQQITAVSFCRASAAGLNTPDMVELKRDMTVTQSGGKLNVVTGVATNAEFLGRSVKSWSRSINFRWQTTLSQRLAANQTFMVLLADKIGDDLAVTVNSATSITVTIPNHGWTTADNAGQFVFVGGIKGISGGVPGRYAIASVADPNNVVFTVAGWPASGNGTACLFGWSHYKVAYTGTVTATNANCTSQRQGWAAADTVATINQTAAPGHLAQIFTDGRNASFGDMLEASTTTPAMSCRAFRPSNLPDDATSLYVYLWAYNGTVAPTTTTWTMGFWSVENRAGVPVWLAGAQMNGAAHAISAAITSAITLTATASGPAAHGAAISGNPNRMAARALNAVYTALTTGQTADLVATLMGALIQKPYSIPEADFAPPIMFADVTSLTAQQIKAATASQKNYVTAIQLATTLLGAAGLLLIRSTPVVSTSATIASNTLVMAATYNWKVGDVVMCTAISGAVTGMVVGGYYYILSVSGANLTFSATRGGSVLTLTGTTVTITLSKVMARIPLAAAALPLTSVSFPTPLDGGTGLAIEAVLPASLTSGTIELGCQGYVAA